VGDGLHQVFFKNYGLLNDLVYRSEGSIDGTVAGGGSLVLGAAYRELYGGLRGDRSAGMNVNGHNFNTASGSVIAHELAQIVVGDLLFAVGEHEELLINRIELGLVQGYTRGDPSDA